MSNMNRCAHASATSSVKEGSSKAALWRNVAFVFGAMAIGFMVYDIGLQQLWDNVIAMKGYFFLILFVWGVIYLLNALSWYIIIRDKETIQVSFARILRLTISGYALNYITPFGLAGGEPYRVMELRRDVALTKATSSVILYAMMHVCSHFFFWLFAVLVFAWFYPQSEALTYSLSAVVICCVGLIYLFFKGYKRGLVVSLTDGLSKIPFLGKRLSCLSPETREKLQVIDQEIKQLRGSRLWAFYTSLVLEFIARMVSCLEVYIIIGVMGQAISFMDAFIIIALSSLFANLLFFFPMQIGTREGGIYLSLEVLRLNPGISVAVSLITRIREAFWIAIGILLMKLKN